MVFLLADRSAAQTAIPGGTARVALVIGNGAYVHTDPLANPANDARLMAGTLRDLGFDVIEHVDLDAGGMKRAIKEFGLRLDDAGEDAVGLFFYAGHGLQVNGANYLVPVSANIERESDVDIEAVEANWVLDQMEYARNPLNIVILDACRNNPLTRGFRATTRGLARMEAPGGTLIAYSTRPGEVAVDGIGTNNSPYTAALAETITERGLALSEVFINVRLKVMEVTGERQIPWEEGGLTANFYFQPEEKPAEVAAAPPPPVTPRPAPTQSGIDPLALELSFWESIKSSTNPTEYEEYLKQFPDGMFAGLARARVASLTPAPAEAPEPPRVPETRQAPEPRQAEAPEPPEVAAVVPPPVRAFEVDTTDEQMFALKNANVRAQPNTDGDKLETLSAGSRVVVTGKVKGSNWYRVARAGGPDGYVYAPLLGTAMPEPPAATPAPAAAPTPATRPVARPTHAADITAWLKIKDSTQAADFEAFLESFPDSAFAPDARKRRAALIQPPPTTPPAAAPSPDTAPLPTATPAVGPDKAAWEAIKKSMLVEDHKAFLEKYPDSEFAPIARHRLGELERLYRPTRGP